MRARAFVDASGEGDLAFFAGASTRYGNDGLVNLGTLGTRFGGIGKDVVVTSDQLAQAVARGAGPFTKDRSAITRLPISGDLVCYVASADYDPRDARSFSDAERHGREQAWAYLAAIRTIPGCGAAYLVSTGPEFGTRESRHIDAVHQLTWQDVVAGRAMDDAIALGAWGVEWHDRKTFESTFVYPPDKGTYPDPAALPDEPRHAEPVRRRTSGRRRPEGGASLRVMGTAFATGQAAGVAAALVAEHGGRDAAAVRAVLRRQGALIDPI